VRQLVRKAVGLAAVAPGLALLVLAVFLFANGGLSGVLAGCLVGALGLVMMAVALMATHAPVSISKLLGDDDADEPREDPQPGPNGHGREIERP